MECFHCKNTTLPGFENGEGDFAVVRRSHKAAFERWRFFSFLGEQWSYSASFNLLCVLHMVAAYDSRAITLL